MSNNNSDPVQTNKGLLSRQGIRHTHISVMFSLSWGDNAGMLVILSGSRHCSMAKEHVQDDGQPPWTAAGARLSRESSRDRARTWAWGAAAILTKWIFSAGTERLDTWRWSLCLCGGEEGEKLLPTAVPLCSGRVDKPSWSGSDTEQQLCGAAGGAGERWASGDMVVVVVGWSLPPSLLHHREREGHRNRGQRHQTPLEVRVGNKGGGAGAGLGKMKMKMPPPMMVRMQRRGIKW